mgnify:CR=1 FL=1
MNALLATAAEIQNFLQQAGERFCFIGGIAVVLLGALYFHVTHTPLAQGIPAAVMLALFLSIHRRI